MPGALAALLGAPAEALLATWDRAPRVFRGDPARLVALLGPAADPIRHLPSIACEAIPDAIAWHANRDHADWLADRADRRPFDTIRPTDAPDAIAAGASVQVNGIEHATDGTWAPVADAARRALAELGLVGRVGIALTWSPPGARFAPHVDPAGALIVQLAGRKRYTVGVAPWCDPADKAHLFDDGTLRGAPADLGPPPATHAHVLGPGDALYLAPGTLHATEALEESAALLLMWMTHDAGAWIADVLARHVGGRLPVGPPGPDGALPPAIKAALAARLDALRALLDADHPLWARAWHESVARDAGPPPPGQGPPPDRLRWTTDARARRLRDAEGLWLYAADEEFALDGPWAALLGPGAPIPPGLDPEVLRALYRRGFLVDAE